MRITLLTLIVLPFMLHEQANAADFTNISQIPVILNVIILIGAVACLIIGVKLFNLVRGGALAKGCQLWVISFIALIAGQVFTLAQELEVLVLNFDVAAVLYATTVILWFAGLIQTRKVLG